jgi:hypothetical protein
MTESATAQEKGRRPPPLFNRPGTESPRGISRYVMKQWLRPASCFLTRPCAAKRAVVETRRTSVNSEASRLYVLFEAGADDGPPSRQDGRPYRSTDHFEERAVCFSTENSIVARGQAPTGRDTAPIVVLDVFNDLEVLVVQF